jgi:hypothetical protein
MQTPSNKMTPWNRPEDAAAREIYKKFLQDKIVKIQDKITVEDYKFVPDIFKEVSEEEAYAIYWASETR